MKTARVKFTENRGLPFFTPPAVRLRSADHNCHIQTVVPTAAKAIIAAAIARTVSNVLTVGPATTTGAGRGAAGGAGRGAADAAGAAPAALRGGAAAGAAGPGGNAAAGAAAAAGPPGGNVGSLIVGAAEGFGGRLILTVSFLG